MSYTRLRIKVGTERLTVAETARRIGISPMGLWNRLKRGVSRELLLAPGYGPRHASDNTRPLRKLHEVTAQCGSAFGAAMQGELTADEYLKVTDAQHDDK